MAMIVGDSVIGALALKLNGSNLATSFPGGIWACQLPEETGVQAYPALVIEYGKTDFRWTFENTVVEKCFVDLRIWSAGAATSEALMRQVLGVLTDNPVPVGVGTTMQVFPQDLRVFVSDKRGADMSRFYESWAPLELDFSRG